MTIHLILLTSPTRMLAISYRFSNRHKNHLVFFNTSFLNHYSSRHLKSKKQTRIPSCPKKFHFSTMCTSPPPIKATTKTSAPSLLARYSCASISCAIFSVWFKFTFQSSYSSDSIHSYHTPLFLTSAYLVSLPLLKYVVQTYLAPRYDLRELLKESMILYNVSQVALNGWMVCKFIDALLYRGHPFIGDIHTTNTGTGFIIWVHYCDKYLEFFDTYFMVLRGRMDQVRCILQN